MTAARPEKPISPPPGPLPEEVEVLVVGAGPAGALAGRNAARAGARTLVIEAKSHIGARCHCAEWVPALLAREVAIPQAVRRSTAHSLDIRLEGSRHTAQVQGFVIDRPAWERGLAEEAVAAGAQLACAARLAGLYPDGAQISGPGGMRTIKAGVIIAADGALSRTAAALGLNRIPGVPGLQVEVDLKAGASGGLVAFRPDLLGYLWLFPKGTTANLGLGGRMLGDTDLKTMLLQWWAELEAEGLVGWSVFRRSGGRIPVGGPRQAAVARLGEIPVLLTGDAAGLTHPLTGAGIPQAVVSGGLAGTAAAGLVRGDSGAAAEYQAEVTSLYGGYLNRGLKRRARAAAGWQSDFSTAVRDYWPLLPKSARSAA